MMTENGVLREMIQIFSRTQDIRMAENVLKVIEITISSFPPVRYLISSLSLVCGCQSNRDSSV